MSFPAVFQFAFFSSRSQWIRQDGRVHAINQPDGDREAFTYFCSVFKAFVSCHAPCFSRRVAKQIVLFLRNLKKSRSQISTSTVFSCCIKILISFKIQLAMVSSSGGLSITLRTYVCYVQTTKQYLLYNVKTDTKLCICGKNHCSKTQRRSQKSFYQELSS